MKKIFTGMIVGLFFLALPTFGSKYVEAAELQVQIPTERAVYQRNEKNRADLLIRVTYEAGKKVSAVLLSEDGEKKAKEVALSSTEENESMYEGILPGIPAGGWYRLEVKADGSGENEGEVVKTVEKIGVGEVFITGGQSNSCNFGWAKTSAQEDMVSAFHPTTDTWQHCEDAQPCISGFSAGNGNGSPWPSAGDALYSELKVPIGFVTTGFGGSTVTELMEKHYEPIKDAITSLKPYGYRALLFHQGEGDSGKGTKKNEYADALLQLINKTREDAGYNLFWMVANAAYNPYTSLAAENEILEAQKEVCNEEDIFLGPLTDDMLAGYRGEKDNLHFNEAGLKEHGRRWAEVILQKIIPDYSQLPPEESLAPSAKPVYSPPVANTPQPPTNSPSVTNAPQSSQSPSSLTVKLSMKGKVFHKGLFRYKIISDQKGKKKVKVMAIRNKKSVVIPKKVKYKGVTYQISSIDKKILKKLKKVKNLQVPSSLYKMCKVGLKGKGIRLKKY